MTRLALAAASAAFLFLGAQATEADASSWVTTSGKVWTDVHPTSFNASIPDWVYNVSDATIAGLGAPDATFFPADPHDLNFSSPPAAYTVGGFLNNPVFLTGGGVASDPLSHWLGHAYESTGTDIQLFGSVLLPHGLFRFDVIHDDGAVIVIDGIGTVFNAFDQYQKDTVGGGYNAGAAGLYSFHVNYNECCTGPAILHVGDPRTVVPEPSTWSLMILGFGLAGLAIRRRPRAWRTA